MKNNPQEEKNREKWDDVARVHFESYGVGRLYNDETMLSRVELDELGDLRGKDILHLQCHIGTDTLSLEREGAQVTGVDFSEKSLQYANRLKNDLNLNSTFLLGNVLDLEKVLDRQFDMVYTGKGVLGWISDIKKWAGTISTFLKPGGTFYIYEFHPFAYIFDDGSNSELKPKYRYFFREPLHFENEPDYSNRDYISPHDSYEWMWTMSDIINALIGEGITIQSFNEYNEAVSPMFPFLEEAENGNWKLPPEMDYIPLMFSVKGMKREV